jgi:methylated-DNA-[protein]-cysteine S-methyltransferase
MKVNNQEVIYIGKLATSPLGPIWVAVSERGLVAVEVSADQDALKAQLSRMGYDQVVIDQTKTAAALQEISEYLHGERQIFEMPIDWSVLTPFQVRALHATYEIPYGQVATYGEIAQQLGNPRSARAVGRAEATNPMPLVIPCHRVIGTDGGLHGYGAGEGIATKAWLLKLEAKS